MPVIDHESVLADLRAYFVSKNSFGQRELLRELAAIESKHRVEEGLPERALRLYGEELFDAVRSASDPAISRGVVVGAGSPSRGASPEGEVS